ncbi:ribonuclease G [bacterium]|nr:ribonuclease G [bacterium]
MKELPAELSKFNWGAFLLNWIWGVIHKKYITLLIIPASIVPIIGPLAMSIWFGFVGNRWAWESKDWTSVEEFNEAQKFWVRLWLVLFIFGIIFVVNVFFLFAFIGSIKV